MSLKVHPSNIQLLCASSPCGLFPRCVLVALSGRCSAASPSRGYIHTIVVRVQRLCCMTVEAVRQDVDKWSLEEEQFPVTELVMILFVTLSNKISINLVI